MQPHALPTIALDPLAEVVAIVDLAGVKYEVVQITAAAYNGAQELKRAAEAGVVPDPGLLFRTARSLVPKMPDDIADKLTVSQAMAICLAATDQVGKIEKLFPKGAGAGSPRKPSRPRTR